MLIAPPQTVSNEKPVKQNRSFLADTLSAKMREHVIDGDGNEMTVAQAMTERLANIAMFAESNSDAINAQKLIYERLYGKAAVQKDEDVKPMPKVIFTLNEEGLKKVDDSIDQVVPQLSEEFGESVIVGEVDGKVFVG